MVTMVPLDSLGLVRLRHCQSGVGRNAVAFAQLGRVFQAAARGAGGFTRRTSVSVGKNGNDRGGSTLKVGYVQAVIAQAERTFRLPIDYYQILGAEPRYLADAVVRAFESRVNNSPREGFSQQALLARLEILRGARDSLADPELKAEYNQALAEDEVDTLNLDVPWTKVGGALCLLHEVHEAQVVLQAGQTLLAQQENLPNTLNRDVVLAMALSFVELSREAMAESPPAVVKSCSLLESALKVLREVSGRALALDLQEQIEGTLDELAGRCILELLALPFDKDYEHQRAQGLQGLRALLWNLDSDGNMPPVGGLTCESLMKEAFSLMTAAEQVALFTATPNNIPANSAEVYAAALAHVAEGFVSKTPRLIQEADALFLQLQQSSAALTDLSEHPLEFTLERGICALLIGEVEDCRAWLGLDDENSPLREPSIVDYVYSYSEEGAETDSLPGLCKLLEGWLSEMVFPRFRDTESLYVKLSDYFDDPSVLSYLEGLQKGNDSHMAAAAAIVRIGAGAGAALKATLKRVFPIGSNEGLITNADLENPVELPRRDFQQFVTHQGTDGDARDPSIAVVVDGENWEEGEAEQEGIFPRKDWKSADEGSIREGYLGAIQIACSGLVFGALVMASLRFLPLHPRVATQVHTLQQLLNVSISDVEAHTEDTCPFPSPVDMEEASFGHFRLWRLADQFDGDARHEGCRKREAVEVEVPQMEARLAELMVRRWQTAKALALGSTHDMAALPEVLDGDMLKSWRDRASSVKRNGWFWEYTLLGLTVDSVTVSDDGKRATVEATLEEAAGLVNQNYGERNDSYRSTYATKYDLLYGLNGWRMCGGAVLRS